MLGLICFWQEGKCYLLFILQTDVRSLTTVRTGRACHCRGFVTETLVTLTPLNILHSSLLLRQLPQLRLDETLHGERKERLLRLVRVVASTPLDQSTVHHHLPQQTTEHEATANSFPEMMKMKTLIHYIFPFNSLLFPIRTVEEV